jgi:hypothetical protein
VCYPVAQSVPEAEHAIQHAGQEYAVIVEGPLSTQIGFEQSRADQAGAPGAPRLAHEPPYSSSSLHAAAPV